VGARSLIYLRKREDTRTRAFRKFLTGELVPALAGTGALRELRTQVFMPWKRRLWNTPNVAHDNPTEQRFHASLILGFTDAHALGVFYGSERIAALSGHRRRRASRVRGSAREHGRAAAQVVLPEPVGFKSAILTVVDAEEPPLRVFFGEGPTQMAPQVYQQRLAEWAEWAHVSKAAEGK
jgi:hypothetical protein